MSLPGREGKFAGVGLTVPGLGSTPAVGRITPLGRRDTLLL